ncbi:MAG: DUF4931 domain-containing protein [Patescibacteria group bacterium]
MQNQYRYNQLSGQWVIIAPGRSNRPGDFVKKKEPTRTTQPKDFFLEGNEKRTPPEILAIRKESTKANTPGWSVRVIPNKYPVFEKSKLPNKKDVKGKTTNLPAYGYHEIVITSHPKKDFGQMSLAKVSEVVHVYMERYRALTQDEKISSIVIIQNHGPLAGASISHPHSQIFAHAHLQNTTLDLEVEKAISYHKESGRKILEDLLRKEVKEGRRIIKQNNHFVVISPYASRFPFEVMIIPKNTSSHFESLSEDEAFSYAQILQEVLAGYFKGLLNPDYNMYVRTPPIRFVSNQEKEEVTKSFLWYTSISPRLTTYGGFEYATDMIINPIAPEEATKFLKKYIK